MWSDTSYRKLKMLIPRLASDLDGEIASSVRAISNIIRKEGKDWHDIADIVIGATPNSQQSNHYRQSTESEKPKSEWMKKAEYCCENIGMLRGREVDFANDMRVKLRWIRQPTERQAAWLDSIYERVLRENKSSERNANG
jgi:hypothetical protein